jgi:hypothetical protein
MRHIIEQLSLHWEAVAGAMLAVVTYFWGRYHGARSIDPADLPTARQHISRGMLGIMLIVASGALGCSSTWAENARRTIAVGHAATKEALLAGIRRLEQRCGAIAERCGKARDRACPDLIACHQRGDSILTAYGAANAAMGMALLAISAAELAAQGADELQDSAARAELRRQATALAQEARRQLAHAQRQSQHAITALQQEGIL